MRKKIKSSIIASFIFTILLFFPGCTLFKSVSDKTRLFDIGFRSGEAPLSTVDCTGIRLVLNHFPEYLNQPQITTKIGEHELKSHPLYRWATPLSESILHIVKQSIRQSFPKTRIYEFPKDVVRKVDLILRLDVNILEINEIVGQIILKGMWSFLDEKYELIDRSNFDFHEQLEDSFDYYSEIVTKVEQVVLNLGDSVTKRMEFLLKKKEKIQ